MNKPYYIIGTIITLILIMIFIGSWAFLNYRERVNNDSGFTTQNQPLSKEPSVSTGSDLGDFSQKELNENRGYKVSELASKLPQNGQNFSLSYDFDTDEFTLYINPDAQEQGNSELTAFLKQNQIDSISWLYNLKRVNQRP